MSYLIDTNVVSELRKSTPDPHVMNWIRTVPSDRLYLSALVIGEIRQGIERKRRRDAAQADALDQWLTGIETTFTDRVIPVTTREAEEWGRLSVPDPLPAIDGLMAATAKIRGWTFVSRNVKDVARTGVHVLDPFEFT